LADIAAGRRDDLVNFNDIRTLRPPLVNDVFAAYTEMYRSVRRLLPKEGTDRQARNARAHLLLSLVSWIRKWIGVSSRTTISMPPVAWATSSLAGWRASRAKWVERPVPELGWPQPATGERAVPEAFSPGGDRACERPRLSRRIGRADRSAVESHQRIILHHYSSKEELVAACFERTLT